MVLIEEPNNQALFPPCACVRVPAGLWRDPVVNLLRPGLRLPWRQRFITPAVSVPVGNCAGIERLSDSAELEEFSRVLLPDPFWFASNSINSNLESMCRADFRF